MMNNSNNTIAGQFCIDGQGMDREHIAELIYQGIEVDDDDKALLENIELDVDAQSPFHDRGSSLNLNWDAPTTFP